MRASHLPGSGLGFQRDHVRTRIGPRREVTSSRFIKNHPPYEIVAIAASAGGLGALTAILGKLPAQFAAIIVVVQHLDPRHRSLMPQVVGRRSTLPVHHAVDAMTFEVGHVYLAPPDQHL